MSVSTGMVNVRKTESPRRQLETGLGEALVMFVYLTVACLSASPELPFRAVVLSAHFSTAPRICASAELPSPEMPAGIVCLHCGDLFTAQGKLARHIGNTPACRTYYDTLSSERAVTDENPAQSLSEPAGQRVEDIEQSYPHILVEHPSLTDLHAPPSPPLAPQSKRPRVTVEEVCDEDEEDQRWVHEVFPGRAGESLGLASTYFEAHRAAQQARNEHPHTPFADEDEWGLVQWLTTRTTQTGVDEWCKLPIMSTPCS